MITTISIFQLKSSSALRDHSAGEWQGGAHTHFSDSHVI